MLELSSLRQTSGHVRNRHSISRVALSDSIRRRVQPYAAKTRTDRLGPAHQDDEELLGTREENCSLRTQ